MTGFVVKLVPDAEMAAVFGDIVNRLAAVQNHLNRLEVKMATTDEKIVELNAVVSQLTTVVESSVALMTGLHQMLMDAQDDPAQLQQVIDAISAQKDALAAAVAANTPAEEPPAEPVP